MHNLDFQATTYPNGKFESQIMCNEDKTDGYRVFWYKSGRIKSATEYKHGKPDGLYTAWHENGTKSAEINYLNGHRHGVCRLWHKDGSKHSEVVYDNGKMNGLWVVWHSTGEIKKTVLFKDYRKISKTNWYSDGNIKSNIEFGDECCNRLLHCFSDVNDGEWPIESEYKNNYHYRYSLDFGIRYPILKTHWYKNGQKSSENVQYGYDSSFISWHENGIKSFESGNVKDIPNVYWDDQGVKEYECLYTFDSDHVDWKISYRFFNGDELHMATVVRTDAFDEFIQWDFFDALDNKLHEYTFNYSKDKIITDDELWDIWLNFDCNKLTKILKSIDKHKSAFCNIPN